MTPKEFLSEIQRRYTLDTFDIEDIQEWIFKHNIGDSKLEDLYTYLKYQYKYKKLTLANMLDLWKKNTGGSDEPIKEFEGKYAEIYNNNESLVNSWNSLSVVQIINILKNIRKKNDYDYGDRMFLARFGDMYGEYGLMIDKNKDKCYIQEHLEHVRNGIISGSGYLSFADKQEYKKQVQKIERANKVQHVSKAVNPEYFQN